MAIHIQRESVIHKFELQDVMEALVGLDTRVNQCIELVQGVEGLVEEIQHAVDELQELLESVSGLGES